MYSNVQVGKKSKIGVFNCFRNVPNEPAEVRTSGRLFHTVDPAIAKARLPKSRQSDWWHHELVGASGTKGLPAGHISNADRRMPGQCRAAPCISTRQACTLRFLGCKANADWLKYPRHHRNDASYKRAVPMHSKLSVADGSSRLAVQPRCSCRNPTATRPG